MFVLNSLYSRWRNWGISSQEDVSKDKLEPAGNSEPVPVQSAANPMDQLPEALCQRLASEGRKLKIEILECDGGAGHKMSAEAVKRAVENHFGAGNVEINKYDVGSHLAPDPLSVITFGRVSVIHFHNYLARHGHTKFISIMSKVGKVASRLQAPVTKRHFQNRYEKSRPDLVISAIPLINGTILNSLSKQNIPLMVVTTDGDNSMFCANWHQNKDVGPYRYGIAYNSLEIARKVSDNVDMSKVRGIGYPLRPGYTKKHTPEDREEFRRKHQIKPDEKVVGLMMGGLGGQVMEKYFKTIMSGVRKGKLNHPNTRFAFFCGNNDKMRETLIRRLKKRGWQCDLSGRRSDIVKNCMSQKRKLSFIQDQLEMIKAQVSRGKPVDQTLQQIQSFVERVVKKKESHLGGLNSDLETVAERGKVAAASLAQDFLLFKQRLAEENTDKEKQAKLIEEFSAKVLKVKRTYGNIEDDIRVFVHTSGAKATVMGFTADDHEYVAVSDLWVTKTGSSTFNQCLYTQTPMLLDGTSRPIDWEKLNFELSDTYVFGQKVSSFQHFFAQLNHMLMPEVRDAYRSAEGKYLEKRVDQTQFSKNIVDLTYELLEEAEERKVELEEKADTAKKEKIEKETKWKELSVLQKTGAIFSTIFFAVVSVIRKIVMIAFSILIAPFAWIGRKITNYAYFSGFNCSKAKQAQRRKQLIHQRNAEPIEGDWKPLASPVSNRPIDAMRIPSTSVNPTGNAVVYVLGKHYQDFHPQNFDHLLEDGADVILFNPSKSDTKTMAADLKEVIKELRKRNPEQKLMLHGYCIGAHVAASVAADIAAGAVEGLAAESIPAIIDRGFEDAHEMGAHANGIAKLPFVKKYVNRYYNAKSNSIREHTAPMLFVTPLEGDDQLNHRKSRNFTLEIMEHHTTGMNQVVQLTDGDHWTAWSVNVHNKVKNFLAKQGIIDTNYRQVTAQDFGGEEKLKSKTSVPWVRRNLVPIFV